MSRIGSNLPRPLQPAPETQDKPKLSGFKESHIADFLTNEQQHALASGDVDAQQIADDAALAMGIQASLDEMDKDKSKDKSAEKPTTRTITDSEFNAQHRINDKLGNWFAVRHMTVVPNQGKNQNCLLISLLQHATGNYHSQHEKAARDYKDILTSDSQGQIGKYDPLYDDTASITALIKRINETYQSDMRVDFYTADLNDNPAIRSVGDGKMPVIIFNQVGHFEAVISGRLS